MFLLQPETQRDDLCDLAALREKVAVGSRQKFVGD
jgi:hypothetical protein